MKLRHLLTCAAVLLSLSAARPAFSDTTSTFGDPQIPPAPHQLPAAYFQEPGADYPGNDYNQFFTTLQGCSQACANDFNCVAAVYRADQQKCYLKTQAEIFNKIGSPSATTFVRYKVYGSTDFPGADLYNYNSANLYDCLKTCNNWNGCVGTVFQPATNHCWLKNGFPPSNGRNDLNSYLRQ